MSTRWPSRASYRCVLAVGAVVISSYACSDELPDPWLVTTPRIAAMRATPPRAQVGLPVEVAALVVRPSAIAESEPRFWACPLPAGADPRGCLPPGTLALTMNGAATTVLPSFAEDSAEAVVYAAVCPTGEPSFGAELETIRCDDGTQASIAYKRVAVAAEGAPSSANPSVSPIAIEISDGCASAAACARRIAVHVEAADAVATQVVTDFLVTGGDIDPFRVAGLEPATRWEPPRDLPPAPIDLWVITRDGEGGITWQIATLALE